MKNLFSNYEEAENLIKTATEFDEITMQSLICMMIDACSAKYHTDAREIATNICTAVHEINDMMGAYRMVF